jgi:hypothetical protein
MRGRKYSSRYYSHFVRINRGTENKGTSSVPDEGRENIERPPYLLVLDAASRKTEALLRSKVARGGTRRGR